MARRLDRGLLPFMGPAQIGSGRPEEPNVRSEAVPCPICGRPMLGHEIIRSADHGTATRMVCPS